MAVALTKAWIRFAGAYRKLWGRLRVSGSLFALTTRLFMKYPWRLMAAPFLGTLAIGTFLLSLLLPPFLHAIPQGLSWEHPQGFTSSAAAVAFSKNLDSFGRIDGVGDLFAGVLRLTGCFMVLVFLGVFFTIANVHLVLRVLKCQKASVSGALVFSLRHLFDIAVLSFLAAPAYGLLMLLSGLLSETRSRANGLAWLTPGPGDALAAAGSLYAGLFFPVMVNESLSLRAGARRTVEILRQTAIENVSGYFGIGLVVQLMLFGVVALGGLGIVSNLNAPHPAWAVCSLSAMSAGFILVSVIHTVFSQVYLTAAYLLCVEGVLPEPLGASVADRIWTIRKKPLAP